MHRVLSLKNLLFEIRINFGMLRAALCAENPVKNVTWYPY